MSRLPALSEVFIIREQDDDMGDAFARFADATRTGALRLSDDIVYELSLQMGAPYGKIMKNLMASWAQAQADETGGRRYLSKELTPELVKTWDDEFLRPLHAGLKQIGDLLRDERELKNKPATKNKGLEMFLRNTSWDDFVKRLERDGNIGRVAQDLANERKRTNQERWAERWRGERAK